MNKTLDFDKFISEKKHEYIDVTIYGDVYKVAAKIPAIVPITMSRSEETEDPAEQMKLIYKAADALLGAQNVDKICSRGLSVDELALLVKQLFDLINGSEEDDTQELSDEDSRKTVGSKRKKA